MSLSRSRSGLSLLSSTKRGFTLIEVILYIAFMALILVAASQVMLTTLDARAKTQASRDVEQQLRFSLQQIQRALWQATSVNMQASVWDSQTGSLSIRMPTAPDDPTVFSRTDNRLLMQRGGVATYLTSPDITVHELRFTNLSGANGPATVRVQVKATRKGDTQWKRSMHLDTSVTLRR